MWRNGNYSLSVLKVLSSQMDVEVVALADCREEFLQKAAAEFPEARTYTYGMELIERENLDAVHICLQATCIQSMP